jgi:hypothetical protein
MRKFTVGLFMMAVVFMFGSPAAALEAPEGFTCTVVPGAVQFDWDDVDGAVKYSVDVEVEFDSDDDGFADMTLEFSFGTSDRTDGGLMGDSDLLVPLSAFAVDIDDDTIPEQISGAALGKVKALAPGRGQGRQNHPFSLPCQFTLPQPEP